MATVKVGLFFDLIPSNSKSEYQIDAFDLSGILDALEEQIGSYLHKALFDSSGNPRRHSLVYHNDEARPMDEVSSFPFKDGGTILIVPAVGGG